MTDEHEPTPFEMTITARFEEHEHGPAPTDTGEIVDFLSGRIWGIENIVDVAIDPDQDDEPNSPPAQLRRQADLLSETRREGEFHPSIDGKLAEAEVNLRGVAGVLEDRGF